MFSEKDLFSLLNSGVVTILCVRERSVLPKRVHQHEAFNVEASSAEALGKNGIKEWELPQSEVPLKGRISNYSTEQEPTVAMFPIYFSQVPKVSED